MNTTKIELYTVIIIFIQTPLKELRTVINDQ